MRAVPSPSCSNLPTFFRWCLGVMPAFASGSGSASASVSASATASARDADARARFLRHAKEMEVHCGRISAKQEEILAHAHFIGGEDSGEEEEEVEAEVFVTPPLTQDSQGQGQSQRGQAGEGEDGIVMCSGLRSSSARDAGAYALFLRHAKEMEAHCGRISAKQEEILARARFIGGEEEEFSTPPLTQLDPQRQGQSQQRGQAGEGLGEDDIVMCSVPFTQTQPSSPSDDSPTPSDDGREPKRPRKQREPPKARNCIRKVRAGTKIWPPTPAPSPATTAPTPTPPALAPAPTPPAPAAPAPAPPAGALAPAPTPPAPTPSPSPGPELDPLARIVFMIPTAPLPTSGHKNILDLARSRGISF